jgi:hypothetical protein
MKAFLNHRSSCCRNVSDALNATIAQRARRYAALAACVTINVRMPRRITNERIGHFPIRSF